MTQHKVLHDYGFGVDIIKGEKVGNFVIRDEWAGTRRLLAYEVFGGSAWFRAREYAARVAGLRERVAAVVETVVFRGERPHLYHVALADHLAASAEAEGWVNVASLRELANFILTRRIVPGPGERVA